MKYKTVNCMFGAIEETLNNLCRKVVGHEVDKGQAGWKLVQILAFPDDIMVTIIMEKN